MIILSLYDHSGEWSKPWEEAGYEVRTVDLQNDGTDARLLRYDPWMKNDGVFGILAAPPCTQFALSGNRHRAAEKRQPSTKGLNANLYDEKLADALSMVDCVLRYVHLYSPVFWALENPTGTLVNYLGPAAFSFNPSEFAGWSDDPHSEAYTKRTLLWGSFRIPEKRPVEPVHGSAMWARYGGKSMKTKNARSKTPKGFARAFFEANSAAGGHGGRAQDDCPSNTPGLMIDKIE